MRRTSTLGLCFVASWMLLAVAARAEDLLGERLLPLTTRGVVLIEDFDQLAAQWERTQLGELLADPVMEPFAEDLRQQLGDRFAETRDRLGISLEDLRGVPAGEICLAVVEPAPDVASVALLVDVTGRTAQAQSFLEKVAANLVRRGAKQTRLAEANTSVIVFDLPKIAGDDRMRQVIYFLSGNLLGAADNLDTIRGILARSVGRGQESLGQHPVYREVMRRSGAHGPQPVHVRWFIEPVPYAEALRRAAPQPPRRRGPTFLEVARSQGFDAIRGVGGTVSLAVDEFEAVHRVAVFAPPPYPEVTGEHYEDVVPMRMITLPNRGDFELPPWVPADAAACTVVFWDILAAFDNVDALFDQIAGEGITGIWADVKEQLLIDPLGPQIDVREELIQHLGEKVIVVTDYQRPITPESERVLFAIEARNDQALAAGIRKTLANDPTMRRREHRGLEVWEAVEAEREPAEPPAGIPRVEIPTRPGAPFAEPPPTEEMQVELLPNAAVTVGHGYLFIASHYDYLIRVLDTERSLAEEEDFRRLSAAMEQLGAGAGSMRSFTRTDRTTEPVYELIREGRLRDTEMLPARALRLFVVPADPVAARRRELDGSHLPPFDEIRNRFGLAGTFVTSLEDGWLLVGFSTVR